MRITHQHGDPENQDGGYQRSHHRDEFQHARRRAQHQRVRHAGELQERDIGNERKCRQRQLRPDELRQHPVQIAQHALQTIRVADGNARSESRTSPKDAHP